MMLLLQPYLNKLIDSIDRRMHVLIILLILYFGSFVKTISGTVDVWSSGGHVEIFLLMYFVGAAIRKYNMFNGKKIKYAAIFIALLSTMVVSEVFIKYLSDSANPLMLKLYKILPYKNFTYFAWPMEKFPVVMAAVAIFATLKDVKLRLPKAVRMAAQSTFGVYLIHISTISDVLFKDWFDLRRVFSLHMFPIWLSGYALTIFAGCVVIDQMRIIFLEKPVMKAVNSYISQKSKAKENSNTI